MKKSAFVLLILLAITLSAHDLLPDHSQAVIWRILAALGADVAMTPLTFDMALMPEKKLPPIRVEVTLQDNRKVVVPWSQLGFYEFRLPALLLVDYVAWAPDGFVYAICYQLKKIYKSAVAFQIKGPEPPLGQVWTCHGGPQ